MASGTSNGLMDSVGASANPGLFQMSQQNAIAAQLQQLQQQQQIQQQLQQLQQQQYLASSLASTSPPTVSSMSLIYAAAQHQQAAQTQLTTMNSGLLSAGHPLLSAPAQQHPAPTAGAPGGMMHGGLMFLPRLP
jgi:hypothetical protein